jgi:subfamily B ATP-binding cassette protein MsbA
MDVSLMQSSRQLFFRLLGYFRPYLAIVIIAVLMMGVAGGVEAAIIRLLKEIVDGFSELASGEQSLWFWPAVLFIIALVRLVSNYGHEYLSNWLSAKVTYDLRQQMHQKLMHLPSGVFDKSSAGELLSRVTYDVNSIMEAGLSVITAIVKDGVMALGLLGILLYTDWQLALFCLVLIPAVGFTMKLIGARQRRLSLLTQESMGGLARILNENIAGQRVVKVFTAQFKETERFRTINQSLRHLTIKRATASASNSGINLFLVAVAIALIVYFAGLRAQSGSLTAGDFVSFMGAMLLLQQPVKKLSLINDQLQRGLASAQTVFALIDQKDESDSGTLTLIRAIGKIEFNQVYFSYLNGGAQVLSDVDLCILPGESVAFVGRSGSGKTTLINLLSRFYDGYSGSITLDGIPIERYKLNDYRQQFALVSQDVTLFNATVAENIAYGDKSIDLDRVKFSAKAAYANNFIERMPNGYQEELGEDGVRLSGGQRQRIAIARAIYRDAPILILDEATSALDTESERSVQAALENLMKARTTIVIAHRLSTIERVDKIIVMDQGRLVEAGSHMELMKKNGLYASMYEKQFLDI